MNKSKTIFDKINIVTMIEKYNTNTNKYDNILLFNKLFNELKNINELIDNETKIGADGTK